MNRDVRTIGPQEPVLELVNILASGQVGSLPVVRDGRLVGVVSQSDVVRSLALEGTLAGWMFDALDSGQGDSDTRRSDELADFVAERFGGKRVEDLMRTPPVTVGADDEVTEIARQLRDHRIHHAPVVEAERFVGIVSTFDLTDWIVRESE